jgi:hypothetical protein
MSRLQTRRHTLTYVDKRRQQHIQPAIQSSYSTKESNMIRHDFRTPASRQRGQGMSEYIIITALVAVAGIGLFAAFGDTLQSQMASMSMEMSGQSGSQDIQDAQSSAGTAQTRAAQADSLANYNQQTNAGGGAGTP